MILVGKAMDCPLFVSTNEARRHLILDIIHQLLSLQMPSMILHIEDVHSYLIDAMSGAHHNFQPAQILLLTTSQAH